MGPVGWLIRDAADVPGGDEWLTPGERAALGRRRLAVPSRRADWRLGRFTAKAAAGGWLGLDPCRVQVLAAADGSPRACIDGAPAPLFISISHRGGRALVAVSAAASVGCDIELIEPRSDAFVSDWLAPHEQRVVRAAEMGDRPQLVNLIWSAKEAAAKVRRAGLRLDLRAATVRLGETSSGWRPLEVVWSDGSPAIHGWWWVAGPWIYTIAGATALEPPVPVGP